MEKKYERHYMWRVFYGEDYKKEAYFTDKKDAEDFSKLHKGIFNRWSWEVKIEEML